VPATLPLGLLLAVNAAAFAAFGVDKWLARRGGRRIAEAHLLWLTFLGGVLGAWAGMAAFRHKTRKRAFRWKWAVVAVLALVWMVPVVRWWLGRGPAA
jgi:uncharacterized membrane protein YsdA (DUF1294 family)